MRDTERWQKICKVIFFILRYHSFPIEATALWSCAPSRTTQNCPSTSVCILFVCTSPTSFVLWDSTLQNVSTAFTVEKKQTVLLRKKSRLYLSIHPAVAGEESVLKLGRSRVAWTDLERSRKRSERRKMCQTTAFRAVVWTTAFCLRELHCGWQVQVAKKKLKLMFAISASGFDAWMLCPYFTEAENCERVLMVKNEDELQRKGSWKKI